MKLTILGILLHVIVPALCMILLAVGLWYIFGTWIKGIFREQYQYRRLEKTVSVRKSKESSSSIVRHLLGLFKTVFSHNVNTAEIYMFLIVCSAVFLFSIRMLLKLYPLPLSFAMAAMLSAAPYLVIRLRLRVKRISNSYDADLLVTCIMNEYRQHSYNMVQAIEKTAVRDDMGEYSKRNLYRLSLALKAYYSEEELDLAVERFVYCYDTEWASLLGINIKVAVHSGTNVSNGLEDIISELKEIRSSIEKSKRYNREAFAMIRFLLIPLYLGTIYLATNAFGFTLRKFIDYQFLNPVGLRFAVVTFMSMFVSFIAFKVAKRPKYDI